MAPNFNTTVLIHNAGEAPISVVPVNGTVNTTNVLLQLGAHPNVITLADKPEKLIALLHRAQGALFDHLNEPV